MQHLVTRRAVLVSALVGPASAIVKTISSSIALGSTSITGCYLQGVDFRTTAGKANFSDSDTGSNGTSGDSILDDAISGGLQHIAKRFRVRPAFAFYDESVGRNAFATPYRMLPRTDGSVLFGTRLLRETLERDPQGTATMAVIAHEFAHIVQFQTSLHQRLMRGIRAKLAELHADYLAGFYMGIRHYRDAALDMDQMVELFRSLGDSDYGSPMHHGRPEERVEAIAKGYNLGANLSEVDFPIVIERGADFVQRRFSI